MKFKRSSRSASWRKVALRVIAWITDGQPTADRFLLFAFAMMIVSAVTNIIGFGLFLPSVLAFLAGVGLQALNTRCQISVMSSDPVRAEAAKRAFRVLMVASVFFTTVGFDSIYTQYAERVGKPLEAQKALKKDAQRIEQQFAELRSYVRSKLENEKKDADAVSSTIEGRLADNLYKNPADGRVMLLKQKARISEVGARIDDLNQKKFVASDATSKPDISDGYRVLQETHDEMSQMLGVLTASEAGNYQLPAAPVPQMSNDDVAQDELSRVRRVAFSLPGLIALILALILEISPMLVAQAEDRGRREGGVDDDSRVPVDANNVVPLGDRDAIEAQMLNDAHATRRLAAQAGTMTLADVERNLIDLKETDLAHAAAWRAHYEQEVHDIELNLVIANVGSALGALNELSDMTDDEVDLGSYRKDCIRVAAESIQRHYSQRDLRIDELEIPMPQSSGAHTTPEVVFGQ